MGHLWRCPNPDRFSLAWRVIGACLVLGAMVVSGHAAEKNRSIPVLGVNADGSSCILGGLSGGKWRSAADIITALRPNDTYRLFSLQGQKGIAPAIGAPKQENGECENLWYQELALNPLRDKQPLVAIKSVSPGHKTAGKPATGKDNGTGKEIGTGSPPTVSFKLLPPNDRRFSGFIERILKEKGITRPYIRIRQLIEADFDGDGKNETLINAFHSRRGKERKGEYSILLLVRAGEPKPLAIVQIEISDKDSAFASLLWENTIVALTDMDGDGALEIITSGSSYFGSGWELIRYRRGKVEHTLFCGCEG
jgi:hypothetical protein